MLNKKIVLFYLILSVLIIALINGAIVYFKFFKTSSQTPVVSTEEKNPEEILNSLTAPPSGEESATQVLGSLSAPGESKTSEGILKNLAAPK